MPALLGISWAISLLPVCPKFASSAAQTTHNKVSLPLPSQQRGCLLPQHAKRVTHTQAETSPLKNVFAIPDTTMAKALGLNETHLQGLMELPGTCSMYELKMRLVALSEWNRSLKRGLLPDVAAIDWPQEPFKSKFLDVLKKLELPRFTRRHPQLLNSLLKQFIQLVNEFEGELQEQEQKGKNQTQQQEQQNKQQQASSGKQQNKDQEPGEGGGDAEASPDDSEEGQETDQQDGSDGGEGDQKDSNTHSKVELEEQDDSQGSSSPTDDTTEDQSDGLTAEDIANKIAEKVINEFEDTWGPAVEAMEVAETAFDSIDGLLDGSESFDSSNSVWHASGWKELDALRKKLEVLRELRDLVRSLGRGGGKGPLKRAPEQIYATAHPSGVLRSELSPEETRGLTRSGDLSRMLPLEAHLLAAGWPRYADDDDEDHNDDSEPGREGSRPARLLFMARRAERALMSYERAGWTDDQPSRLTGRMEIRPAAELGPIIVCLDTSGSMMGARETVAKALALECMRGASRQGRKCYVYAFSGPADVAEIELGTDVQSIQRLLTFLGMSFSGGTDVDAPLALSLERLKQEEWALADILMVTDGEIPQPNEDILHKLQVAHEEMGLNVHGLLVGRNVTDPMKALCHKLHVFKSWSAVQ